VRADKSAFLTEILWFSQLAGLVVERRNTERMKPPPHAIDVYKRKLARVGTICEKNKNALVV
jgi:hypothetical protein